MSFEGRAVKVLPLDDGFVELRLDLESDSVNKLSQAVIGELEEAIACLPKGDALRGVLVTSGKDVFVVGADVTEFVPLFSRTEEEIQGFLLRGDRVFSSLEDLEAPSVVAINGVALGGGFELCLAASYRVMSTQAKVGLPETKLGIFPGWGGTVRLSRVCGADTAIEWIATGEQYGGDRGPEGRSGGRRRRARGPSRGRAHDAEGGRGRPARLEAAARGEEVPAEARPDRGGDGVHGRQGLRGRQGRAALPGTRRRDRRDGEGRGQDPRRGARDRGRGVREGGEVRDRPLARERLPRRPGGQEDREEGGQGGAAGAPRGRPRRGDHGRRHRLPVGLARRARLHEGRRPEGARGRHGRGGEAPREAGRAREAQDRADGGDARLDHADALLRRLPGGGLRRRGGRRERAGQEEGPRRGRGAHRRDGDPHVEHLDDLDHAPRDRAAAARRASAACTSSTRSRGCRSSR